MSLEDLKRKAKDLGIKGASKRGKFTKRNKGELEEVIFKAEASGCRVLNSVKDLDIPSLENVTCEDLCNAKDEFDRVGFTKPVVDNTKAVGVFNAGMAFAGFGLLVILGASSWYFFPKKP